MVHGQRRLVRICLDILAKINSGSSLKETVCSLPLVDIHGVIEYAKELEQFI